MKVSSTNIPPGDSQPPPGTSAFTHQMLCLFTALWTQLFKSHPVGCQWVGSLFSFSKMPAGPTPGEPGEQPLPEVLRYQPLEASGAERGSKRNLLQANDRLSMRNSVDGRQLNHGPYCDYDCFHSYL